MGNLTQDNQKNGILQRTFPHRPPFPENLPMAQNKPNTLVPSEEATV
jgi:hypothetical protein